MEKNFLEQYNRILPLGKSISTSEAEKRASLFLEAMAKVTDMRHQFAEQKIRASSELAAVYAQELSKGTAKTMTENKVTAEASENYCQVREELEGLENDTNFLRAYYEIYQNAHVFYRQAAKGEQF